MVIVEGEKVRAELAQMIDPALLKLYEQTLERCGGVALAELVNNSCGACRISFDQSLRHLLLPVLLVIGCC